MAQLHVLTPQRHQGWYWQPRAGAGFAAHRWMAPVVITELPQVIGHFPLMFQRSQDGRLGVAALFSLQPEQNDFVDEQGRWRAAYMPAFLRTHPFQLAQNQQKSYVVMLDEASPVVDPKGQKGQPILQSDGQPTGTVNEIVAFLKKFAAQQYATAKACDALDQHQLLVPLSPVPPAAPAETPGLYRIDQKKLDALQAETLVELRNLGGLSLAYAQLLSMPRLNALQQQETVTRTPVDLDALFGKDDILRFDF